MKQVTYITASTTIRDAIYYVQDLGHRNISVVDDEGKLLGIVTRASIVERVYDAFWHDYEPELEEEEVSLDSDKASGAIEQVINGGEDA